MAHINNIIPETLDPLQFQYRPNRSTEVSICIALHTALSHLDKRNTYVRMLFIDYSSAFNTIVLSPLPYSVFTHDCTARHDSNTIIKFADDTTAVGLITDYNETTYREEVRDPTVLCKDNNFSLNVIKAKERFVDYRKRRTKHSPVLIDGAVVEQVESFKFLGVHITNELTWSKHTKTMVKRARQNLFPPQ
jgi:hypothetical protein